MTSARVITARGTDKILSEHRRRYRVGGWPEKPRDNSVLNTCRHLFPPVLSTAVSFKVLHELDNSIDYSQASQANTTASPPHFSTMSAPIRAIPPGIRSPARRKITNKAIGDEVTFILYSTESPQQSVFKVRCIVKPGGGVPLHYHRNCSEHFKVLKGVLTAVNGSAVLKLGVGEETLIPVMTDHLFRNDTEGECEFEGTVRVSETVLEII